MSTGAVMLQHDVPMHGLHVETRGPDRLHEAAGASHMMGNAVPLTADTPHPASRMSGTPSQANGRWSHRQQHLWG